MNCTSVSKKRQQGAILVVSLMFLIAITLLTISSMGSSNMGLHMAQNEEARLVAEQGAQALADAIVSDPATTPVIGGSGYTICTPTETNCVSNSLPITNPVLSYAIASGHISAKVERIGLAFRPPSRLVESSIDKFSTASFEVTTTYDRVAEKLGREQITEGVLVLVPKL
jgi:hypothetical protein